MNSNVQKKWAQSLMQSSEYAAMYHCENDMWWYKGLRNVLQHTLKDLHNAVIVDAGCGTGKNMEFLKELGHQVYGFDISQEAIHFCQSRGLDTAELGDITTVSYPDNFADVLLSMDVLVLLHEEEIDIFMKNAARILKPGGKLLIHVAALPWLFSQHDIVCNVKRRYTKKTLKKMLLQYPNFEIRRITYRMFLLFPLIAGVKLIKKVVGKNNPKSDQGVPPKPFNFILTQIQYIENFLLRYVSFPWGTSLYAVLHRK
ncbi:MAG: class I SAM-dependent methyltransferase [Bacteroidia bacterium]|nr:class I SAM-dependent methyltransferase [Bacteroidia bacterium]MDW8302294.1 class I SAM-dependent methyltransferase [Bacteroidia bacterium]